MGQGRARSWGRTVPDQEVLNSVVLLVPTWLNRDGTTMGWLLTSSRIPAYIRNCETLSSRPSFAMWNGEQLEQETVEPIGFPREGDVS